MRREKLMVSPNNTKTKITVRRGSSSAAAVTSSQSETTRVSRQMSDVSDVSTTTPVTPRYQPRRVRRPQNSEDPASSSCSSTEALNQQTDDVWTENPVYDDQRRRRKSPASRRIRKPPAQVDTRPLDDLLDETRSSDRTQLTRSSTDLHRSASPPPSVKPPPTMSLHTSASNFKSEPNVAGAVIQKTLIVDDAAAGNSAADACHGSMLDCISVDAPDDTVIKPSQLRASMRQRRRPAIGKSADDSAVSRSGVSGENPGADAAAANGGKGMQRNGWRSRSMREPKRTDTAAEGGGLVHRQVAATNSSSSSVSAASPSPSQLVSGQQNNSGRAVTTKSTSPVAGDPFTFSIPVLSDAGRKKVLQSPEREVLPSFPRSAAFVGKAEGSAGADTNGVGGDLLCKYTQLLHEHKELWKKYSAQQDELKSLRQLSDSKDSKIRLLEEQLKMTQRGSAGAGNLPVGVKGVC